MEESSRFLDEVCGFIKSHYKYLEIHQYRFGDYSEKRALEISRGLIDIPEKYGVISVGKVILYSSCFGEFRVCNQVFQSFEDIKGNNWENLENNVSLLKVRRYVKKKKCNGIWMQYLTFH